MNKYLLKFKDAHLEEQYQIHKGNYIQFPLLTYLTIGGTILLMANAIADLINSAYTQALIKGAVLLYLLIQYFFFHKFIQFRIYCNQALMLTNFISVVFEIQFNQDYQYYDGYLLGSNQMLVHAILMFACSLELGIFSNIVLTAVRIVLSIENQGMLTPQQFCYSIVMAISFIFILFKTDQQFRHSYLLSLKDNSFEIMIPHLIRKPLLLFTFNKLENAYQLLLSHQKDFFDEDLPLNSFLYNSRVNKKTLQYYIAKRTKQSIAKEHFLFNHYLNVEYKMNKFAISVIGFKFEKIIYAIIVESEDPMLKESQEKFTQSLQQYRDLLNQQLFAITRVIGTLLTEQFHPLLRSLRIALVEIYHQQQLAGRLQLVKMRKLLFKCVKIFATPQIQIKFDCSESIKFVTLKSTLIVFLFEIFKTIDPNQNFYIIITQQKTLTIFMYGLRRLPNTQLFEKSKEILVEKIVQKIQYFSFELMRSPQSRFPDEPFYKNTTAEM